MTSRRRDQDGVAAVFFVFVALVMVAVAGLVIDGGYAMAAKRTCQQQAEQAARAGADALNQGGLRDGTDTVNPQAAQVAAHSFLTTVGAHGTVTIDGRTVTVTVTTRERTTILSAVGVDSLTVSETATARSISDQTR